LSVGPIAFVTALACLRLEISIFFAVAISASPG
jgi:hypothetical protein